MGRVSKDQRAGFLAKNAGNEATAVGMVYAKIIEGGPPAERGPVLVNEIRKAELHLRKIS